MKESEFHFQEMFDIRILHLEKSSLGINGTYPESRNKSFLLRYKKQQVDEVLFSHSELAVTVLHLPTASRHISGLN